MSSISVRLKMRPRSHIHTQQHDFSRRKLDPARPAIQFSVYGVQSKTPI